MPAYLYKDGADNGYQTEEEEYEKFSEPVIGQRPGTACIAVGKEETGAIMTENAKKNRRYSGLKLRLQEKDR